MAQTDRADSGTVRRLEFSIDWPPGHAAAYLITGSETVLVDAGVQGETGTDELLAGLDQHGYSPSDVDHLVLTHAHADHVGQVRTLQSAGAKIYAPAIIRRRFQRDIATVREATRENMVEAGVPRGFLETGLERQIENLEGIRRSLPLDVVDEWIDGNEVFEVGERTFEAIPSPGHHVTHYCYLCDIEGETVAFSGDVAIASFRPLTLHANLDEGVRDGVTEYLDTLERLQGRSPATVFPGHGPVHDSYRSALADSVSDLRSRVESCHEHVRESGSTAVHISQNVSRGVEEASRLLPEVVGALSHLERNDRLVSELEDGIRYYRPR